MHFCGVASASAVRGAAGQLAFPLHKALSRARTSEQETHTVDMLSLSGSAPLSFHLYPVYLHLH